MGPLVLIICWVGLISSACVRDTYTNLPNHPAAPSSAFPAAYPSGATYVKDHYSSPANLADFRPPNTVSQSQSNCPHLASGLKDWHDPATWGGSVPGNGSAVNIPANTKVLISSCSIPSTYVFGLIKIPSGSSLVFGDAQITFQTSGMSVSGSLLIGSPTCRIRNKITITVHGKRSAQSLPAPEYVKGIFVDGVIDVHGVEYFATWTRLAKTVSPGDEYIFIQDCPNWQVGQSIVITTTELKDSRDWHRNEEFSIAGIYTTTISSTTCAIKLSSPAQYTHYGGDEYQAEVALLSRNILIQGDPFNSEPTDTTPIACWNGGLSYYPCENKFLTGFGVHIFVTVPATAARFSGLEVFRGGQTNVMGRYPIHFHMLGNLTAANKGNFYASDCSVHRSFFRCYTIHGTSGTTLDNGVTLTKNTGYDVIGHCFFCSEDGVEENNTISYNLGAHIHPLGPFWHPSEDIGGNFGSQQTEYVTSNPNLVLADDISAAPFYFTNAMVKIVGNAASGGWAGFAFPNLDAPVGNHQYAAPYFSPRNRPMILFQGNSAHSTGFWQGHAAGVYLGGHLYTDGSGNTVYTAGRRLPARDTCNDARQGTSTQNHWNCLNPVWLQFYDTKVFLANVGLQSWGDRCEIVRFEVHDVAISTNVFGEVWIDQMMVECRSRHRPVYLQGASNTTNRTTIWSVNARDRAFFTSWIGFQFYDTGQSHILTDTTFKNCNAKANPDCNWISGGNCDIQLWSYLTHSDQFTPGVMQATRGTKYINSDYQNFAMVPGTKKADKITVSGRDAHWIDYDGSITGDFLGSRTCIGSDWAGPNWWRYNERCVNKLNNYVCPLSEGDSTASLNIHWNIPREGEIGGAQCPNGGSQPCDIGGYATHFGRGPVDPAKSFNIALSPRTTGPIISSQGGWHLQFTAGTPKTLVFNQIQVDRKDLLHLAIPYPVGTVFNIYAEACTYGDSDTNCNPNLVTPQFWCNLCYHNFFSVSSIAAVRDMTGGGDRYFYDSSTKLLHIRIVTLEWAGHTNNFMEWPNFGDYQNKAKWDAMWNSTVLKNKYFARNGVSLLASGYDNVPIKIVATNCGTTCAQVTTTVPPAMPLTVVPSPPTNQPTSLAPTKAPTPAPTTAAPTTAAPSLAPTVAPTTAAPTKAPTVAPTTTAPTKAPTVAPTTAAPTGTPTVAPTTAAPTGAPSLAPTTTAPTKTPTVAPTTAAPTGAPSLAPTGAPTVAPTTVAPTKVPTVAPTTAAPTGAPTGSPTGSPTVTPTVAPTVTPTNAPTAPTNSPTSAPVGTPTNAPTPPTDEPTVAPTTASPTVAPTVAPTTAAPTVAPTVAPTTVAPTSVPTETPTTAPTVAPTTASPTDSPTEVPSAEPTNSPTEVPVGTPTDAPTPPTDAPTVAPTTASPTEAPTAFPTEAPTAEDATAAPTVETTNAPTSETTKAPTDETTNAPTSETTNAPTTENTNAPTDETTNAPTSQTTNAPTVKTNSPTTRCNVYTDCSSCLANGCNYCPWWENRNAFQCQEPSVASCRRRRVNSCEDTNEQIMSNWTITNQIVDGVRSGLVSSGLDVSNLVIDTPKSDSGKMTFHVTFSSKDDAWTSSQQSQACDIVKKTVSSEYSISSERVACSFSVSKRALNGQASVSISEVGQSPSSNQKGGIEIWMIVVAAVGGVLFITAIILIVVLVVMKSNKSGYEWEKY